MGGGWEYRLNYFLIPSIEALALDYYYDGSPQPSPPSPDARPDEHDGDADDQNLDHQHTLIVHHLQNQLNTSLKRIQKLPCSMFVRFASKVVLGETREIFTALLPILLIYSTSCFQNLMFGCFVSKVLHGKTYEI